MAEDQADVAEKSPYIIVVEESGPAARKVRITVPQEHVAGEMEKKFKTLRREASLPGFRPGKVPPQLLQKRFAEALRGELARELMDDAYRAALAEHKLAVLGEPDVDDAQNIKIADGQPLVFSFSVEVQPEFELPNLKGIKVKKPKIAILPENIDQALTNLREQQGTLVPIEEGGVRSRDLLTADVHVLLDGNVVTHEHDASLVARPGVIAAIRIDDLDKQLEGLKPGDKRTINAKAPEEHANEAIRGKDVQIEVALKDLKRLEPAKLNAEFLESLGFDAEQGLRDALREQMEERIQHDVKQSMREQVSRHLLDQVQFEVPTRLSEGQTDRIVQRRAIDLLRRGVPMEQIETDTSAIRTGAADEARRELKLFFILQKLAETLEVEVDESELNGQIAMIAAQRDSRPEKLKAEMAKDGRLANLYVQLREQKALEKVLEDAEVEEVAVTDPPPAAG